MIVSLAFGNVQLRLVVLFLNISVALISFETSFVSPGSVASESRDGSRQTKKIYPMFDPFSRVISWVTLWKFQSSDSSALYNDPV